MDGSERGGDWLLVQELFERGDPAFVDELRMFDNADALGAFAQRWMADRRPEARQLLQAYLDRPLNAYRHEALVKRLFKRAENSQDDEVMAWFLVAFDRAVRRVQNVSRHFESVTFDREDQANAMAAAWRNQGFESVGVWKNWQKKYQVSGRRMEPIAVIPPDTTMPRGMMMPAVDVSSWNSTARRYEQFTVPDWVYTLKLNPSDFREKAILSAASRKKLQSRRLFSLKTRYYLQRRAWRYFRKLGRSRPQDYIAAIKPALLQYRDEDASDGISLLDNWGLMHALFHFSDVIKFTERNVQVTEGRALADLEPAPIFAKLWNAQPRAFVDLLLQARSRAVKGWATRMIRRNLAAIAPLFSLEERLSLLANDDPEVVSLAADLLRNDPSLAEIPVKRWLQLVDTSSPTALELLTELMSRLIPPERITLIEACRLAMVRPLLVARMGFLWLKTKSPHNDEEYNALLGLADAGSQPIRAEMLAWVVAVLSASPLFRSDWVLDWLDSSREDVRKSAWNWFETDPRVANDVSLWQRLMESPYDDIRLGLVHLFEARTRGAESIKLTRGDLDPELLRLLWASVLLNIHRGNRAKPVVVQQILARIESKPNDLPQLLPLLAVALRSHRGPELRAGLAAMARLASRDESFIELIRQSIPELQFQ